MLLEQILAPENLQQAWKRVQQNKGAAGIDGLTVDHYLVSMAKRNEPVSAINIEPLFQRHCYLLSLDFSR